MMTDIHQITLNDLVMRYYKPEGEGPFPVLLMLHGWTGDETSMWVFAPRLLKNAFLIAPRGIYTTQEEGYSWYIRQQRRWPTVDEFSPAINTLLKIITVNAFPEGDFSRLHLIGFSQGAALAYSMTSMHPERIASLSGLSGFLPEGSNPWLGADRLKGLPVFIAHGTQDDLVPVDRARASVDQLEKAGAAVTYCEDDVGHKLSAKCFRGLEAFYGQVKSL